MKGVFCILFVFCYPICCNSQVEDTTVYNFVDEEAKFSGNFLEWLNRNMNYEALLDTADLNGKLIISFVVEKDGSLTRISLEHTNNISQLKALQVFIERSPKWIPAKLGGEICRSKVFLPININFQ